MQYRENSYTVPLVKNNKSSQDCYCVMIFALTTALDVIPAPVIIALLEGSRRSRIIVVSSFAGSHLSRRGIPRCASSRLKEARRGVYITNVEAGHPANKAGMKVGDIVTRGRKSRH